MADRRGWQPASIYRADGDGRLIASVACDFTACRFVVTRVCAMRLLPEPGEPFYMGTYLKTLRSLRVDPDGVAIYHYR